MVSKCLSLEEEEEEQQKTGRRVTNEKQKKRFSFCYFVLLCFFLLFLISSGCFPSLISRRWGLTQAYAPLSASNMPESVMVFSWACKVEV